MKGKDAIEASSMSSKVLGHSIYEFYHRRSSSRLLEKKHSREQVSLNPVESRRISVNQDIMAFMEGTQHERALEELLDKNWLIYRSSPLFEVPKSPAEFEAHSLKLSRLLIHHGLFRIESSISSVLGLRGSVADQNAIKITIHLKEGDRRSPSPIQVAFLLGIHSKDLGLYSENASVLPLLLIAGLKDTIAPLLESLQTLFDCVISRVTFMQEDLQWMFALWSGFNGNNQEKVFLDYALPSIKGIKLLQLALDFKDVLELWKSVHPTLESEFTLKEMKSFYDQLYAHIEAVYGIQLHALKMNIFSLPAVTLNQNGVISIHSVQHLKSILGYLTERFQMNFLTTPRIGIQADSLLDE